MCNVFFWIKIGPEADPCKHENQSLGSTKGKEFLTYMHACLLTFTPWCRVLLEKLTGL